MRNAHPKLDERPAYDIELDRHEAKYVIPRSMLPQIRDFIRPFCNPAPFAEGDPPEYVTTTLQLDTPDLALHHAKENKALNRFKLRVRTYGTPGKNPVFLEVKRKVRGIVVKSRARLPPGAWGERLIRDYKLDIPFSSEEEEMSFLEFVRLTREIGARPVVWIRYIRESYLGKIDHYGRVTMDRDLCYQPTTSWDSWGEGGNWISMDSTQAQGKQYGFSGVVLELKALSDAPGWMVDLVREVGLARTGNCKYSTALWQEALFRGTPRMPAFAQDVLTA